MNRLIFAWLLFTAPAIFASSTNTYKTSRNGCRICSFADDAGKPKPEHDCNYITCKIDGTADMYRCTITDCNACKDRGIRYTNKDHGHFSRHVKSHLDYKKLFKCTICSNSIIERLSVNRHVKTFHPDNVAAPMTIMVAVKNTEKTARKKAASTKKKSARAESAPNYISTADIMDDLLGTMEHAKKRGLFDFFVCPGCSKKFYRDELIAHLTFNGDCKYMALISTDDQIIAIAQTPQKRRRG